MIERERERERGGEGEEISGKWLSIIAHMTISLADQS